MKRAWLVFLGVAFFAAGLAQAAGGAKAHRLGVGANYWVTVDDLNSDDVTDLEEDGLTYFASYQYWPAMLGLELLAEMYPDYLGVDDAYSPEAYLLVGGTLYAGAGIGMMYMDSEWADDPFYALKAGLNLELLPSMFLDISANYRFNDESEISESKTNIDTDTVFMGAAVRLGF